MEEEDIELFTDNCKKKTCNCPWDSRVKFPECPRRMFVSNIVATGWLAWKEGKEKDKICLSKQKAASDQAKANLSGVDYEKNDGMSSVIGDDDTNVGQKTDLGEDDPDFNL
jgi:hypothetical protein